MKNILSIKLNNMHAKHFEKKTIIFIIIIMGKKTRINSIIIYKNTNYVSKNLI
jgi:hypothetical protein